MNGDDDKAQNGDETAADAMAGLERQARAPVGFVPASTGPQNAGQGQPASSQPPAAPVANPDAIEVDVDDDDE